MTLNQELLDVFKKSLPEHANKSIIETFEENKGLQEEVKLLQQNLDDFRKRLDHKDKVIASASAENKELRALVKSEEELIERENVLKEKELEQKLTILQNKYDSEKESKNEIKELVALVFRNPVLRKTVNTVVPETYTNYNYNNQPETNTITNTYTNIDEEEIV